MLNLFSLPVLLSAWAPVVHAAAYDPALEWRTLQTEHFEITFHQGEEQLANELGTNAEGIWAELTVDMDWVPKAKTQIVLVDHTDMANGYASTVPYNAIVIFVTAPQESSGLAYYDDWSTMILTHEFAHILHLDNVQGAPALLRYALGRIISVNQLSPWWIVEGSATYQETRHTGAGRGHLVNPHSEMQIRTAWLEGDFPTIDQMDGFMSGPPGGNTRYVFGQSFLAWVADNTSDDAITRWNSSYGGWWFPYYLPAKKVFGQTWVELYKGWTAWLGEHYEDQLAEIASHGTMTTGEALTDVDGSCFGANFSPSGNKIVWACSERATGSNIFLADSQGNDPVIEVPEGFASTFTWRPDGQAFAYSASHIVDDFNLYDDIYFHTLGTKGATRLTNGKRARDPAFSPDGSELLVVQNRAQNNNLGRMRIDQTVAPLTDYSDHTQLSTPVWSPDGRFIALSAWQDGQRDLWLFNADGSPYRRVTMDPAMDRDPAFSADGRTLYFASDRSGVSNLYAVDMETESLFQVTNVTTGAFQPSPSPDGRLLIWQEFSFRGYQLMRGVVDRALWQPAGALPLSFEHRGSLAAAIPGGPLPEAPALAGTGNSGFSGAHFQVVGGGTDGFAGGFDQPTRGADQDDVTETLGTAISADLDYPFDYPVTDYQALPTLLPPRYLMPSVYSTGIGLGFSLSTSSSDQLKRHLYGAAVNYRSDAGFVGWGLSYTWNHYRPIVSLSASRSVVPYQDIYRLPPAQPGASIPIVESTGQRYWDQRLRFGAGVSYSRRQRTAMALRWNGNLRRPLETPLPSGVYEPLLPTRGFISTLSAGWSYYRGRAYSYSISPEDSRLLRVNANVNHGAIGAFVYQDGKLTPFNRLQLTGEVREYLALPWAENHVLGLRAAGGVSVGDQLNYGSFILGGSFGESPWVQTPAEWQPLRGHPVGADRGDGYYLGSIEYRAPLWRIDRGWRTAPIFLRTLHGAAFVDFGDAFYTSDGLELPRVGVGAEVRMSVLAGWGLGFTGRLGYAVGVRGPGGYGPTDPGSVYLRLGSSF